MLNFHLSISFFLYYHQACMIKEKCKCVLHKYLLIIVSSLKLGMVLFLETAMQSQLLGHLIKYKLILEAYFL